MDNCSIHHVDHDNSFNRDCGWSKTCFFDPDLMPSEETFSKVKSAMKNNDKIFQVCTAPRALLAMAFSMVTPQDCDGFIQHSGYIFISTAFLLVFNYDQTTFFV